MHELTVIMPVYNGEKFLEETIESILCQTFTNFKFIILNDNSTDSTLKILENYKAKDDRIIIINKDKNEGPAILRNEGIALSETNFIALMDADDIAMPTRFEKQIKVLKENENIGLCGTWFTVFNNKKEKLIKHATFHEELKVQFFSSCGIGNPTTMFKKNKLGDLKFETELVPAEDYGLWSQLIKTTEFYNIPESLLRYRWHDKNISQTKADNLYKSEQIIRKRQLANLGIMFDDINIEYYLNCVSLKKKMDKNDVIKSLNLANLLLERNYKYKFYNQVLLETHIIKVLQRTIRNCKNPDMHYFKILKTISFFKSMRLTDKVILLFKCLWKN